MGILGDSLKIPGGSKRFSVILLDSFATFLCDCFEWGPSKSVEIETFKGVVRVLAVQGVSRPGDPKGFSEFQSPARGLKGF